MGKSKMRILGRRNSMREDLKLGASLVRPWHSEGVKVAEAEG